MQAVPLVTEALLLFGWEPETVLNMPARRFFALLREGRRQKVQNDAARDVASVDIASIALGDAKYYDEVRRVFLARALGKEGEAKRKQLDPTDPATVQLVEALTMQASRLGA